MALYCKVYFKFEYFRKFIMFFGHLIIDLAICNFSKATFVALVWKNSSVYNLYIHVKLTNILFMKQMKKNWGNIIPNFFMKRTLVFTTFCYRGGSSRTSLLVKTTHTERPQLGQSTRLRLPLLIFRPPWFKNLYIVNVLQAAETVVKLPKM